MFKFFTYVFIVFCLSVPKNYGAAVATAAANAIASGANQNDDGDESMPKNYGAAVAAAAANAIASDANQNDDDDEPIAHNAPAGLVPHISVFDSIEPDCFKDKEFDAFMNTQTQEIFYYPRTRDAMEKLVDKINFAKSIYMQARTSEQEQEATYRSQRNPELYEPSFMQALEEINRNRRISEIGVRDILSYLSSFQDSSEMPDICDSILGILGISYGFTFTEGFLSLDFSLDRPTSKDWVEDTIVDAEDSCALAIHLGFAVNLARSNPIFGYLEEKAKAYSSKAANSSDTSREYIAMLRSADSLYQILLDTDLESKKHVAKFKEKFKERYGINLAFEDDLSRTNGLSVVNGIINTIPGYRELIILLEVGQNGEYIFNHDQTLQNYINMKRNKLMKKPGLVRHMEEIIARQTQGTSRVIRDFNSEKESRKKTQPENEGEYKGVFTLLDEINIFSQIIDKNGVIPGDKMFTLKAPQKRQVTPKLGKQHPRKTLEQMFEKLGIEVKPQNAKKKHHEEVLLDDADLAILERESKLKGQGMHCDSGSAAQIIAIRSSTGAAAAASSGAQPVSKNTAKRVVSISKAMASASGGAAAASSGPSVPQKTGVLGLFMQRNQANIDFYDNLRSQKKSLADATPFAVDFFHPKEQPQYRSFKSALIGHGFKVISHGEKDHFCWKVSGKFYHFAVDRAHGTQAEKGKAAGWFLRSQQKITESGIVMPVNSSK